MKTALDLSPQQQKRRTRSVHLTRCFNAVTSSLFYINVTRRNPTTLSEMSIRHTGACTQTARSGAHYHCMLVPLSYIVGAIGATECNAQPIQAPR